MQSLLEFMNRDRLRKYKVIPDYKFDFKSDIDMEDFVKEWLNEVADRAGIKEVAGFYNNDEGEINIICKYGTYSASYRYYYPNGGSVWSDGYPRHWDEFEQQVEDGQDPFRTYFNEWLIKQEKR